MKFCRIFMCIVFMLSTFLNEAMDNSHVMTTRSKKKRGINSPEISLSTLSSSSSSSSSSFSLPTKKRTEIEIDEDIDLEDVEEEKPAKRVTNIDAHLAILPKAVFCRQIKEMLCNLISHEKSSIETAQNYFAIKELSRAWAEAKKNHDIQGGLLVGCSDANKIHQNNDIYNLVVHQIPVKAVHRRHEYPYFTMHHKFWCFGNNIGGKSLVVTGSFNCTDSAAEKNDENIVVLESADLFAQFQREFKLLFDNFSIPIRDVANDFRNQYDPSKESLITRQSSERVYEPIPQAFFSPGIKDVLLILIENEQACINSASFCFNDLNVAKAWACKHHQLSDAGKPNPSQLVVDKSFKTHAPEALRWLLGAGVPVKKRAGAGWMHHKFFIFGCNKDDKRLLLTGSYNPTGQGNEFNCENSVLIEGNDVIADYLHEFERVYSDADDLTAQDMEYEKYGNEISKRMNGIIQ